MATTKLKPSSDKNPKRNPSLGPKKDLKKKKSKKQNALTFEKPDSQLDSEPATASEQLNFFLNQLDSAIGVRVSSLELDPIKDKCVVELDQNLEQNVSNLGEHIKMCYGSSWKETLCEGETIKGDNEPGNPSVLVISSSALRSLELLRGLNSLTKQCPAVKLFSKHLKVEEQEMKKFGFDSVKVWDVMTKIRNLSKANNGTADRNDLGSDDTIYRLRQRHFAMLNEIFARQSDPVICEIVSRDLGSDDKIYRLCHKHFAMLNKNICTASEMMIEYIDIFIGICDAEQQYLHVTLLKKRVNIGSGTPSRIKKLIDIEALGLSRLEMIVLDMHTDVKGFSLFTLPQVRDEFWDLYKNCFHQRVLEGNLRICLYGPKLSAAQAKNKKKNKH